VIVYARALSAALAALGLALPAFAQEPLLPTDFIFGPSGELTIDSSGPKKLLPVPDEIRQFASEDEYLDWMEADLNAHVDFDKDGKRVYELLVTEIGTPVRYDYEKHDLIDIDHPFLWFVGGRSGFIAIEGELKCINPYLCAPDLVRPATEFGPPELEVRGELDGYLGPEGKVWTTIAATRLLSPSLEDLLKLAGENACEACEDFEGRLHCRAYDCSGKTIVLTLSVDFAALSDESPHNFDRKFGYNQEAVSQVWTFSVNRYGHLRNIQSDHTGQALLNRPGSDSTERVCKQSTGTCN
jgi:hypothetical protein